MCIFQIALRTAIAPTLVLLFSVGTVAGQSFGFPTQSPRPPAKPVSESVGTVVGEVASEEDAIEVQTLAPVARPDPDETTAIESGGEDGDVEVTTLAGLNDAVEDKDPANPDVDSEAEEGRFKRAPFSTPPRATAPELIAARPTVESPGALLRQLDKLSGEIIDTEIASGDEARVDRLRIAVAACAAPADGTLSGTMAYLRIWDTKSPEAEAIFQGWMFADSPALSAMDHPRYDVWVISCSTRSAEASSGNE